MGAPIYLVSACATGEEFVAAFRRYADKSGLFIPIGEPLPPGGRHRFALTLRDGGVMVEGEAEIVSSARAPSVVHGRVGMTLRFVEPDDASRTTLGELERARLAMKPPPPSMPPRPAEIPAEPRPVLPAVQGRIDAVNALAECVAIGDVSALGPPLPPLPPPPTRPGSRSSLPPIAGARAKPITSPPGLGVASRTASTSRASTAPLPIVLARAEAAERAAEPPAITPRATPQPDRLRGDRPAAEPVLSSGSSETLAAVVPAAPTAPGPTSDTMVAASPPAPPEPRRELEADTFTRGPQSATMTAVPVLTTGPSSSPTEIGGVLVPIDPDDDDSARTQIHAGAPTAPPATTSEITPTQPGAPLDAEPPPRLTPPVTVHGMTPMLRPPAPSAHEIEIGEPTEISIPPEPPSSPSLQLPAEAAPSTEPEAARLSTELDAAARSTVPEVRVVASESGAVSAEVVTLSPDSGGVASDGARSRESGAVTHQLDAELAPGAAPERPRRTVLGVAVGPDGAMVLPAPPTHRDPALGDDDERALVADIDPNAQTVQPGAELLAAAEQMTPSRVWQPDDEPAVREPDKPREPAPPASSPALPSGDWMISLDPSAPDGWSAPFHTIPPNEAFDGPPTLPSTVTAGRTLPPPAPPPPRPPAAIVGGAAPAAAPRIGVTTPAMTPTAIAVGAAPAGTAGEPEPDPRRPSPRPQELPIVEPKVQIDPTLIESAHGGPGPATPPEPPPIMAAYTGPGPEGFEAPALQRRMAVPQPPFSPHGPPVHGSQPAYPLDPSYQDPSYQDPSYQDPSYQDPSYGEPSYGEPSYGEPSYSTPSYQMMPAGMQQPGMFGYGDPRLAHGRTMPPAPRRRHLIIVLVTAVIAVLIGITVMLIVRTGHETAPSGMESPGSESPRAANDPGTPGEPSHAPAADNPGAPAAPAAGAAPAAPEPPPPAPPPVECFADIASQPPGADIVLGRTNVIGTTPQRVALPCGNPVELVIRKARLAPVTRTITPTPEGAALQVALARSLFSVKVSSTPTGATVTLGGKSLGVTPTVVKVPAFASSTLTLSKDGYEPDTEQVAPKANGAAVHGTLKKLERRKPAR